MDLNYFRYLDDMRKFFRVGTDLRDFVASTGKRRKKKPSWNQTKKKKREK